jgi:hypothetical protein
MYAKVYCTSFNNVVLVKFIILNLLLLLVLVWSVAGPYFIATKDSFDFFIYFYLLYVSQRWMHPQRKRWVSLCLYPWVV